MKINRFIDQFESGNEYAIEYRAGVVVVLEEKRFGIGWQQMGAEETFSVGQPVYDKEGNLMGYLGIGLFRNLNYSEKERIPVSYWEICLPTVHCEQGKLVYTYWQNKARMEVEE